MNALVILATFLAAGVEWVEALTIVLAVALFKGWRSALVGTLAALVALAVIALGFGTLVTAHLNLAVARTLVGVCLLLFGLNWLHKAILRSSGLKALHDEAAIFEETRMELVSTQGAASAALDRAGVTTALGGVFLEGMEVVFIVVALGGLRGVSSAVLGALASLVVVVTAGLLLRRPLTQVPENTTKYVVGIMLTSFGTFFTGEGLGVQWWNSDLSLLPLIAAYLASSALAVLVLRRARSESLTVRIPRWVKAAVQEVWGLFVNDGALAIAMLASLFGVALFIDHVSSQKGLAALLLVLGVLAAITVGLRDSFKQVTKVTTPVSPVTADGVDASSTRPHLVSAQTSTQRADISALPSSPIE